MKNHEIIENKNTNKDDYDLYKLYPTNNYSVSTGREYIAVPIDKTFSSAELLKYNIDK